ncbi:MAG: penicillin-binding protein 2 [Bacteroidales bacterium]|nr:penicillin-binding protein 2 [Bacteroidales bacterium]
MADSYSNRKTGIIILIIVIGVIFIIRLMQLQIFDEGYKIAADQNALRHVVQYPARGLIYDRNGELLVYNEAVYDIMVIPYQVRSAENFDTLMFCELLDISREDFNERMKKACRYSMQTPSVFIKQISKEAYGALQEKMYKFKGFYSQQRTLRHYPKPIAAHLLGYIGEIDNNELSDSNINSDKYYRQGDYIGKSGLEKSYETVLRGKKGQKITLVDVHNREKGRYENGRYDTVAIAGHNLYSTIDIHLQEYAEQLMTNKRGCVVAIEPSTGEILTLVSAPTYDPNLLVGRVRGNNYKTLSEDIAKPLFNRALMATYPPGSIFKIAQSMIALDEGVITPSTGFPCDKIIGCHGHPSANCVRDAIKMSCNPYFYYTYRRMIQQGVYSNQSRDSHYGLAKWCNYMLKFGFGQRLGVDLPNVSSGYIPDTTFYDKWYNGKWTFSTIYSNSIGQGEVTIIPLQMANLAAIVANRGYYYTPHLVRFYGEDSVRNPNFYKKNKTDISPEYFEIAVAGMYDVVHGAGGTAHRADIPGIDICGKTGTAENRGKDHSVFICFAPKDKPKIAVAVYVENAGAGGVWAATIASLVVEKYLKKNVGRIDVERNCLDAHPCQSLPLKPVGKKHKKQ